MTCHHSCSPIHDLHTLSLWVQKLALILQGWPFEPQWKLPKLREDKTEIQDRQSHKTASRNRCREAPVFIIDFQEQRLVVRVCLTSFRLAPWCSSTMGCQMRRPLLSSLGMAPSRNTRIRLWNEII